MMSSTRILLYAIWFSFDSMCLDKQMRADPMMLTELAISLARQCIIE